MLVRPTSHFIWQVLRTVKRSHKPSVGRALRLIPSRKTKDGSFLTELVTAGLLARVTGTAHAPFDATYALTERGAFAAEYGEYEFQLARPVAPEVRKPAAKRQTPKSR